MIKTISVIFKVKNQKKPNVNTEIITKVLKYSIKKHCGIEHLIYDFGTIKNTEGSCEPSYKIKFWRDVLKRENNGQKIIFLDNDMLVRGDITDVFLCEGYDLYSTPHLIKKNSYNVGFIGVIKNKITVEFFDCWYKKVYNILNTYTKEKIMKYRISHGAIDQYVFSELLKEFKIKNKDVDTIKYNLSANWTEKNINKSYNIHYKSNLTNVAINNLNTKYKLCKDLYVTYMTEMGIK